MAKKTITTNLFSIDYTDTESNSLWTDYCSNAEKKNSIHKRKHSEISSICIVVSNIDQFKAPSKKKKKKEVYSPS